MPMRRWLGLAGVIALGGCLSTCLWSVQPERRFTHRFDLGGGRTLTVWSGRRGEWLDKDPLALYYRVEEGGREVVPTTFLDYDDGGRYEFRVARADGGRLACVYEVSRPPPNWPSGSKRCGQRTRSKPPRRG